VTGPPRTSSEGSDHERMAKGRIRGLTFLLIEATVVVAERRLLLWALRDSTGPRDRLPGMSIAMNVAAGCLAVFWWI
jgi:hypothetical protein